MFERILLTTDFSPHSLALLELTLGIARTFGSRVLLLHVDEEEQLFPLQGSAGLIHFLEEVQLRREAAFARLVERIARAGIPVSCLRAKGYASEQILACADRERADLIAISMVGVERLKQALVGSTAKKVLRHARCPVLVTSPFCRPADLRLPLLAEGEEPDGEPLSAPEPGLLEAEALAAGRPEGEPAAETCRQPAQEPVQPSSWPTIRRVLAPLSLDSHPPAATRFAAQVADSLDATLELLYVLKVPTLIPSLPGEPPLSFPADSLAQYQGEAWFRLAELASGLSRRQVEWSVTLGSDEAEAITEYARQSKADLLILPRKSGRPIGEFLFGRVSSAVAKIAPAPLLLYVPGPDAADGGK
ncbi:MAG: universal stress protein [Myxococcota bacterium]|jgi:nucleotide-binding universal stress UspA family protein|nr:universal stress protein [Myxococcota bacterium]